MKLLEPFDHPILGKLNSRIAMAAMTRGFCGPNHTATTQMSEYYALRARNKVGLILTEGTVIHETADGYNNVPHIQTEQQAESWQQVTAKVRAEGCRIFCQLWHCGRISHPDYTGGADPFSSTNRPAEGINRQNNKPYGVPKAMTAEDIRAVQDQFVKASINAISAGFDGIQLHLGHGYLADQFFDARINDREDIYGGSVVNRCRFALELTQKVADTIGANKVMIRISPSREMNGLYDWPDLTEMINHFVPSLRKIGIKMMDISCANADYYKTSGRVIKEVRPQWPETLIGGASLTADQAESELENGYLDIVTWGRYLIANPALHHKFSAKLNLVEFDRVMLTQLV